MAVLHYIADDGNEYTVPSITDELYTLVYQAKSISGSGIVRAPLCKLHILNSSSTEAIFLLYGTDYDTLVHFTNNVRTILVVAAPSKRLQVEYKLSTMLPSATFYACEVAIISKRFLFQLKATYSVTVNSRNVAPSTYVTFFTTASTIRVDLQYSDDSVSMAVSMGKTWYCRLKLYYYRSAYKKDELVYTSNTVTVASTATYCTIPKIDTSGDTTRTVPVKLYIEYSFDKSNWTSILLHTFSTTSSSAIACTDVTDTQGYSV